MDNIKSKQEARNLCDTNNGSRRRNVSDSPEFEFWMVRNPTLPQPDIVPADQLFLNGVLLPLHQHSDLSSGSKQPEQSTGLKLPEQSTGSNPTELPTGSTPPELSTGSKRWKDIWFKKSSNDEDKEGNKSEKIKKEGNNNNKSSSTTTTTQNRAASAELKIINIWPFTRSRSAGNNGGRPRIFAGARKASSAPCSRSNSAGDPKSRKLEKSPSRSGGVHLRRPTVVRKIPALTGGGGGKAEVLNVNVPICMGHRHRLSRCKSDEMNVADGGGGVSDGGGRLFHFRSLFTKKVY